MCVCIAHIVWVGSAAFSTLYWLNKLTLRGLVSKMDFGDEKKSDELLSEEREAKFQRWLLNKTLKEKAFEHLDQISESRAYTRESLTDVAISLLAVEMLMGGDSENGADDDEAGDAAQDKVSCLRDVLSDCCNAGLFH